MLGSNMYSIIYSENINWKMDNRISLLLLLLITLLPIAQAVTGVSPVWVASSYFKAGIHAFI